jgi:hypothetical protein
VNLTPCQNSDLTSEVESLDQRLFGNSEDRFITASGEAEAEVTTSDSEYDPDVIVVGKGRKCSHLRSGAITDFKIDSG